MGKKEGLFQDSQKENQEIASIKQNMKYAFRNNIKPIKITD